MPFLSKADFLTIITMPAIDSLTGGNDSIIDAMVDEATLEMRSYLEARYNMTELFSGDGLLHPTFQMYCKDIVLYHLHSRNHAKPMPENRKHRYEKALQWLQDVQQQKCNPFEYLAGVPEKTFVKAGGNEKRTNHQL